ncbi:COX15/CtaA family protein, partial [Janibacter melonis]|uniref:COX15/CtaA family protein n=1 Tax=Janibacter melonis TaxID=262209 RepID=UPI0020953A2C
MPVQTAPIAPTSPAKGVVHPLLRVLLVANLVCQVGLVVTGGLVRLTGSGLGCPTWPQCVPGSYVPTVEQEEGVHKLIEFGNRTLTGLLGFVALGLLWALFRYARERRDLRTGALVVLAGIAAQAVVGGITVLTGLNPWIVAFHFLASMVLVATASWMLWRSTHPAGPA